MNVSIELTQKIYSVGSVFAIIGAAIALFSGVATNWASQRIDKFTDRQIAEARSTAEAAREKAAELNAITERIRGENLELQIQLEREKNDRLKLQGRLGPRRLSEEQITIIATKLKKIQTPASILILATREPEAQQLAKQYQRAIALGGVTAKIPTTIISSAGGPPPGISINICFGNGREIAKIAFETAKVDAEIRVEHTIQEPKINDLYDSRLYAAVIFIHDKPSYI